MLVFAGAGLDLPSVTMRTFATKLHAPTVTLCVNVNVRPAIVAAAYQHVAEGLHLVLIESFDLLRRIVGLVLRSDYLQAKAHSADVDVRGVIIAVLRGPQVRAWIDRNAVIGCRLLVGVDLQVGERSLNIYLGVLLVFVVNVNAARG